MRKEEEVRDFRSCSHFHDSRPRTEQPIILLNQREHIKQCWRFCYCVTLEAVENKRRKKEIFRFRHSTEPFSTAIKQNLLALLFSKRARLDPSLYTLYSIVFGLWRVEPSFVVLACFGSIINFNLKPKGNIVFSKSNSIMKVKHTHIHWIILYIHPVGTQSSGQFTVIPCYLSHEGIPTFFLSTFGWEGERYAKAW